MLFHIMLALLWLLREPKFSSFQAGALFSHRMKAEEGERMVA